MDDRRRPKTDAEKQHLSEVLKGIKRSDETRQKMSRAFKGRKYSEKTRKGISETRKRLFAEGKLVSWNKDLTKADPRVLKNVSGGARDTQFKPGLRPEAEGENNNNWKGGRIKNKAGYWMIRMPEHPEAQNDYVFEHRIIMERHLGRPLKPEEIVHHIDFNKDNNDISNLQLTNLGEHTTLHNLKRWRMK